MAVEAVIISLRSDGVIARASGHKGTFSMPPAVTYPIMIAQAASDGTLGSLPPGQYVMAECGDIQMGGWVFELHPDRLVTAIAPAKSVNLTTWPPK